MFFITDETIERMRSVGSWAFRSMLSGQSRSYGK